jgi:hypothetical protein
MYIARGGPIGEVPRIIPISSKRYLCSATARRGGLDNLLFQLHKWCAFCKPIKSGKGLVKYPYGIIHFYSP